MTAANNPATQATVTPPTTRESPLRYVLDASALLAYLNGEPGADQVQQCIEQGQAVMSSVNLAEVLSKCADQGMSSADQAALCAALPLEILPFDTELAQTSAALRNSTRTHGLSLGDRCCLALAQSTQATALTADQAWSRLGLTTIGVEQIRAPSQSALQQKQ